MGPEAPDARWAVERVHDEYDACPELKEASESELVGESRKNAVARVLRTAPGLGPIRVAYLLPIVVTPHRFRTRRQFWSYCGLDIVMRSTSDWIRTEKGGWARGQVQQTRGLNRKHDSKLKDRKVTRFKGELKSRWTPMPKGVAFLDRTERIAAAANHRYLDGLVGIADPSSAKKTLDRMATRMRRSARSHRGLNPADPDDALLYEAIKVRGATPVTTKFEIGDVNGDGYDGFTLYFRARDLDPPTPAECADPDAKLLLEGATTVGKIFAGTDDVTWLGC